MLSFCAVSHLHLLLLLLLLILLSPLNWLETAALGAWDVERGSSEVGQWQDRYRATWAVVERRARYSWKRNYCGVFCFAVWCAVKWAVVAGRECQCGISIGVAVSELRR